MGKTRTQIPLDELLDMLGRFGEVNLNRPKFPRSASPERIGAEVQWTCNVLLPGRLTQSLIPVMPTMVGEHLMLLEAVEECYLVLLTYKASVEAEQARKRYLESLPEGVAPLPDTLANDVLPNSLETFAGPA